MWLGSTSIFPVQRGFKVIQWPRKVTMVCLVDCGVKGPIDKLEGNFDIVFTPDWDGKLSVGIGKATKIDG